MEKEQIKLAFSKVKQDINNLGKELSLIRLDVSELKAIIKSIQEELTFQRLKEIAYPSPTDSQTIKHSKPTLDSYPTDTPTVPQEIEGLKTHYLDISTGNRGVPTDRQTDRQTNQQTQLHEKNIEENLKKAQEILDSLDYLKKEIRQKFKRLTPQEMSVFSSIYQYNEQDPENTTYKQIANNLKLSESSIRDYVLKIIDKGIPIKKQKIDNKKVILSISNDLKKIATLSTIIQLREL